MNYVLMYTTTLSVAFALTLILYLYHMKYWDQGTHVLLQNIYFLNMTSALMCIVWCITDGKSELSWVNYIANMIEFNCMGFCGYYWLRYCLRFIDIPCLKTRLAQVIIALPVTIVMLMIVSTPLTHWAFFIDEAGFFQRGTNYFLQQTGYVYLLVSSGLCLWYKKKCLTTAERKHLSVLAMFPLSPAFFGSIQILLPSGVAPTLQFSILISLLLVFVDELDQKITRDSLTQLTNHYEFERILQNRMNSFDKYGPKLFVLMCDLDDFKSINDNYGHQQGDIALQMVGRVLNQTGERYGARCARMGGDEFLALMEADSKDMAENFKMDFELNLRNACKNLPYTLKISIGIEEYDGKMNLMQLVSKADKNMYAQKKRHKAKAR